MTDQRPGLLMFGLLCGLLSHACQPTADPPPDPGAPGSEASGGTTGGNMGGPSGGGGAAQTGGSAGGGGTTGGSAGTGADAAAGASGTGGAAKVPDAAAGETPSLDAATPASPSAGQGPVAEGRIVFSQDFEGGTDGITRSPTNLPPDRAEIADDPFGARGKVMKIVYRAGDNYMTNGGSLHTRSWISNTGYAFPAGSTVQIAWGYLTTSPHIDAAFAQVIRPGGPMWFIEGNRDGNIYVNCRSCGGKANLPVRLEPNKWYDIRVEMTYQNGGPIIFMINGQTVLERRMTVNDPPSQRAHWDGGIYNHAAGTYTRTVYISNLSIGLK